LSLIAGLRASGNGSAATMVPTRMSTLSKSAKLICGRSSSGLLIASGVALRLEQHVRKRFARRHSRPDDELECLEIALAGLQCAVEQHLYLLAGRFRAAGQQQRMSEHDRAFLLPQVAMAE